MRVEQRVWTAQQGWQPSNCELKSAAQVVLVFGDRQALERRDRYDEVAAAYPSASVLSCSTSGEIAGTRLYEGSVVTTAVAFERTTLRGAQEHLQGAEDSFACGQRLVRRLAGQDLRHVVVLAEGLGVNGSELVRGILSQLPAGVQVTGGLAGDGERFAKTLVGWGEPPTQRAVAALGFYGTALRVGYGSLGGWDPFGPERLVTRALGNVLYEMDGEPALTLYKQYLGEHAAQLPSSGLLFPLSIRVTDQSQALVRTILAVDEREQSMTFAGNIPQGAHARLMKANFERLVDGSRGAASTSYAALGSMRPQLALLISCVGRKLVLKQRTEEELEAVRDVLGDQAVLAGFYSYGEVCPAAPNTNCELHNQTMTITTFLEE